MSHEDGTAGAAAPVAAGVRGLQQPPERHVVRTAEVAGAMAGSAPAQGGAQHHSLPPPAAAQPAVPAEIAMKSGHTCKLTMAEAEQAIKLRARELCVARGVAVPDDQLDFLNRAEVHWLGEDGPMVTWED